jgi:hypothetical protein
MLAKAVDDGAGTRSAEGSYWCGWKTLFDFNAQRGDTPEASGEMQEYFLLCSGGGVLKMAATTTMLNITAIEEDDCVAAPSRGSKSFTRKETQRHYRLSTCCSTVDCISTMIPDRNRLKTL